MIIMDVSHVQCDVTLPVGAKVTHLTPVTRSNAQFIYVSTHLTPVTRDIAQFIYGSHISHTRNARYCSVYIR